MSLPRVGDNAFAHAMDQLPIDSWRVVHWNDIVVHLPPCCNGLISYFGAHLIPNS